MKKSTALTLGLLFTATVFESCLNTQQERVQKEIAATGKFDGKDTIYTATKSQIIESFGCGCGEESALTETGITHMHAKMNAGTMLLTHGPDGTTDTSYIYDQKTAKENKLIPDQH